MAEVANDAVNHPDMMGSDLSAIGAIPHTDAGAVRTSGSAGTRHDEAIEDHEVRRAAVLKPKGGIAVRPGVSFDSAAVQCLAAIGHVAISGSMIAAMAERHPTVGSGGDIDAVAWLTIAGIGIL